MSRRRRSALLLGLALVLGALAASDVAGREEALRRQVGEPVSVVITSAPVRAGERLDPKRMTVRSVPARYAPAGAFADVESLQGLRAARALPAGADVIAAVVDEGSEAAAVGAPVRTGERVAELVARGSPRLIAAGGRVDVLVTRATGDGRGSTTLALEDAEVLAAGRAPQSARDEGPQVAISLRVSLRQAVYLAAAQSFARELRVLPRAAGDRRRGSAGLSVGSDLAAGR